MNATTTATTVTPADRVYAVYGPVRTPHPNQPNLERKTNTAFTGTVKCLVRLPYCNGWVLTTNLQALLSPGKMDLLGAHIIFGDASQRANTKRQRRTFVRTVRCVMTLTWHMINNTD